MQTKKIKKFMQNLQFGILFVTFASLCTIFTIIIRSTLSLSTFNSHPSFIAMTEPIRNITSGAISTTTRFCTIESKHIVWTGI